MKYQQMYKRVLSELLGRNIDQPKINKEDKLKLEQRMYYFEKDRNEKRKNKIREGMKFFSEPTLITQSDLLGGSMKKTPEKTVKKTPKKTVKKTVKK